MTYFTDLQIKRRSIYALGKDLELSNQELIETIQGAVLNTPTAFNSQTSRVVILLDEESDALWNEIAYSELEKVTPAEAFDVYVGAMLDLFFVNTLGLPVNSGMVLFALALSLIHI